MNEKQHVSPRRPSAVDGIVHRVGSALVAWAERPRAPRADTARLLELGELRDAAQAASHSGIRF